MSLRIGRYLVFDEFARGGMASVHLGRLDGPIGFRRIVAIKRLNKEAAANPETRLSIHDEVLISSRIVHRNVVQVFDVVESDGDLAMVMEYVHGVSLAALVKEARARKQPIPPPVAAAVIADALEGLQAAHDATDAEGRPLEIVHRDMSPQNILVGADGVARVLDFGIAKARVKSQQTSPGLLKGKVLYMAPEQIHGNASAASDIYSTGLVLYEMFIGKRAFEEAPSEGEAMASILLGKIKPLSEVRPDLPSALTDIVSQATAREPAARFSTAWRMAEALRAWGCAPPEVVAQWVSSLAGEALEKRRQVVRRVESSKETEEIEISAVVPRRSPRQLLGVALAVLALGAAMAVAALRHRTVPPPPVAPPTPPTIAAAATPAPAPSQAPPVAVVTVPPVQVTPTPSAPAAAVVSPARHLASSHHSSKRPRRSDRDCDPPYRIDSKGHKQFKAECF